VIKRKAKADLELELKLDMTGASKEVTGTLTRRLNGSQLTVSKIVAKRAHYSSVLKADVALAGAVSQRYHVILPSKAQAPVLAANLYPQGTGIGNFVVKPVGSISCSLKLADNTVVPVWAAKLTEANTFTVFGALYSSKGCFAAEIKVDPTQMDTDASGVDAVWCKYGAVTGTSVVPDLGPEDLTLGNVDLGFSDGLTAGINKLVNVSIADKLTRVPVTDTTFTAAITRSTGGVKGTFIHPSGSKSVAWEATLFQKAGAYQGGHGFFLSPLPKPVTGLGESGKVQFKESGKVQFKAK
jgi:hypothetical protein